MKRLKRGLVGLAAALAAVSGAPASAPPSSGWHANDDDALLFEARLGQYRLGDGVRGYQTPEGICVDLADVVKALDVPVELDRPRGIAEGWAFEERNRLKIDRNTGKVRIADRQAALSPQAVRDTPDGWCILADALGGWLGIELKPDLSNALLLISSETKLPVQLAAERRARAAQVRPAERLDLARLPRARLPYQMWRSPSLDAVVTVGGLVDRRQGSRFDRRVELYGSGEIAGMSVDGRLSSDNKGLPNSLRVRAYRSDIEGGLLGPLGATHFEMGDVAGVSSPLVAQSQPGRGAMVTNRPLDRPDEFDRKTFRGELPAGWDAELYRNGQLLAFSQSRTDGRYEFVDVPLQFGPNRMEIVLYGPQGQVKRIHETIAVGPESIPPRETWYHASIAEAGRDVLSWNGQQTSRQRGWRASAGVERGIDQRTSIAAQVHSLVLEDERLTFVEGSVRRSIGSALVEIGGAYQHKGGIAGRAQMVAQFGNTHVVAESMIASDDFRSDRTEGGIKALHRIGVEHAFDLGDLVLPVHLEGRYVQREGGRSSIEGNARVSASFDRISLTGAVDWQLQRSETGPDPPDIVEASVLVNGHVKRTRLRGEVRWRLSPEMRFHSAALVAERRISELASLRGEIGYDQDMNRLRGGIGYIREFDQFALAVTGEAATDGSVAAGVNLAFSLGPDPGGGGWRLASKKLASTGTVMARIFRDTNGDGIRAPGEPYEKDVQLLVGRAPTEKTSDAEGAVVIDELRPHQPVRIGIDASSLPDPLMQPSGPGIVVTPRPGLPMRIDLPLVSAGEILGTLVDAGGATLEGADIELVDAKGIVIATARSDFDGFFLFEGVPYGQYRLRLTPLSAAAASLPVDLAAAATVDGETPSVRLGRVAAGAAKATTIASVSIEADQKTNAAEQVAAAESASAGPAAGTAPVQIAYENVLMEGVRASLVTGH